MPTYVHQVAVEMDAKEIAKGNSIDLKAGILIAILAVLISTNSVLLTVPGTNKPIQVLQLISLLLSTLASFICLGAIFHLPYERADFPETDRAFIEDMEKSCGTDAIVQISVKTVLESLNRAKANWKINRIRIGCLLLSFIFAFLSMLLNVASIVVGAVLRMHS